MEGIEAGFPGYQDADLATISTPIDWYGINYYNPQRIGPPGSNAGVVNPELEKAQMPDELPFEFMDITGYDRNDFGWPIIPAGFTELLMTMKERYGDKLPPIMITENGGAFNEQPDEAGRVADQRRIDYVSSHLAAIKDAIDAGVDVRGYFHWTLVDNFE